MKGLSPFILTRFDRLDLVRQALDAALSLSGAESGFVSLAARVAFDAVPANGSGLRESGTSGWKHHSGMTGTADSIGARQTPESSEFPQFPQFPEFDVESGVIVHSRSAGVPIAASSAPARSIPADALALAREACRSKSIRTAGKRLAAPLILRCEQGVRDTRVTTGSIRSPAPARLSGSANAPASSPSQAPSHAPQGRESDLTGEPASPLLEDLLGVLVLERTQSSEPFDAATQTALASVVSCLAALEAAAVVSFESQTDRLTGLLNRGAFFRRVGEEIELLRPGATQPVAILMIDIHRLDPINRISGRKTGDAILRLVGRLLHERIRWRDFAARLGGDELAAALPGASGPAALAIAARVRERFQEEAKLAGLPPVALNAGIAVFPDNGSDAGELLRRADQALTAAKKLGPGRSVVWCGDYRGVRERTDRLEGLLIGDPAEDYSKVLTLLDTISEVNAIADSHQLLLRLLDRMIEATDGERALLLQTSHPGAGGDLEVKVARNRARSELDPARERYDHRVVDSALLSGESSCSAPAAGRGEESTRADGTKSALAIPLATPAGTIGVAYIESREDPSRFPAPTLAFLDALGHEASQVLERIRMVDDLARKQREIESLNRRLTVRVEHQNREIVAIKGELERTQARIGSASQAVFPSSGPMHEILGMIHSAAPTDSPVLLTGETGAGKEVIAREVHRHSRRSSESFIAINCAAIPHGLIESELFGHARGAFTGAERSRAGLFEEADGGTLFLDEIASTDRAFQAKLLRVLQEGTIRRVGETADRKVNVRIVAAANVDLVDAIKRKEFREDLYYRLAVFAIRVPALRERPSDIAVLARHFLREACANAERPEPELDVEAIAELSRYPWPGNVRELRNVTERLAATTSERTIGVTEVRTALGPARLGDSAASPNAQARLQRAPGMPGPVAPAVTGLAFAESLLCEMRATGGSFWNVVRTKYLGREITREDARAVVSLGLSRSGGSYKRTAALFNLPPEDYKRFLDFLHNHDLRCNDPREARRGAAQPVLA